AQAIARLDSTLLAARAAIEQEVWPGYDVARPGLLYMLPGTGKLLARWPRVVAEAEPVDGTRGWTEAPVSWGRTDPVQVVPVSARATRAQVLGLALHEGFHVHQRHFAGQGSVSVTENALLTHEYPLFDIENEAAAAAEAQLLRAAVEAPTRPEARRLGAQFVALRQQRHARLGEELAEFERAGEAHEGIAQYVLLRGLDVLAQRDPTLRGQVTAELTAERDVLSRMLEVGEVSVRRRVYATGSQQGFLLDRLGAADWKRRMNAERVWLHDLVAASVAGEPGDTAALRSAIAAQLPAAAASVKRLTEQRARMRDGYLAGEGVLIQLSPAALPGGRFDWCGFDPQNLLPDGAGNVLHTRMVSLCSGNRRQAAFERPVVENRLTGTVMVRALQPSLRAAGAEIPFPPPGSALVLQDVALTAPGITLETAAAVVTATAQGLFILPLPGSSVRAPP
ncbi:MAG TPA: hypothetical protein VK939_15415, partial [Longimicrobiales bacterium]|nr:hypothetical protein [Longimicrobiales bacterium]